MDAGRCLAYWLVEYKGSLPLEIRSLLGGRIFGCDTCTEVCPYHPHSGVTPDISTQANFLREYLTFDEKKFHEVFSGTALIRCGYEIFFRNTVTALGCIGNKEDIAVLENLSHHPLPLVAEHAAWALKQVEKQ